MSKLMGTFLVGILIILFSLCGFSIASLFSGFSAIFKHIPLFNFFVEINERIADYETDMAINHFDLQRYFLITAVLVSSMCLIKVIVKWYMKAFAVNRYIDKLIMWFNRGIWNLIPSMFFINFLSALTDVLYDYLKARTDNSILFIATSAISGIIIILTLFISAFANKQRLGIILVRVLLIPTAEILLISAIYSFVYCAFESKQFLLFAVLSLTAIICYFLLERLRDKLNKSRIVCWGN